MATPGKHAVVLLAARPALVQSPWTTAEQRTRSRGAVLRVLALDCNCSRNSGAMRRLPKRGLSMTRAW
jgi:hypothetical protein